MPKAQVGDIEVYFERQGAGPRLLFISGTGGDLRVKPNVFDGPLGKTFDLLAYDQRGLGQTSKPDEAYSMAGYADDAHDGGPALSGDFYRTGDVATRDADGYITYVGRADDVFKSSDYRISPFELESALIEHPLIAEAAVVPSPDPMRLAVPKAFLVLRAGGASSRETALDIFKFVRERLPAYKRVRRLEFSDLPKTISGKIRRVELRLLEQRRHAANERVATEYRWDDFPELSSK